MGARAPVSAALPPAVTVRDVGPRDGLQAEEPVSPEDRAELVEALFAAGLRRIEAVSFVSPRAVPAMAGPEPGAGRPSTCPRGRP